MTARSLRDAIQNALDFLSNADLLLYSNPVSMTETRVSWHDFGAANVFSVDYGYTTAEQYLNWVRAGAYSALLNDGSLLQLTYEVDGDVIVRHRLAYVPCPVVIDEELLELGAPVADLVPDYLDDGPSALTLRSPVRFDFDQAAAGVGHPAAHLTINSPDCRIACVAPLHPYRFVDFVFRHFYPSLRAGHEMWFEAIAARQVGSRVLSEEDGRGVHISWPLHTVA